MCGWLWANGGGGPVDGAWPRIPQPPLQGNEVCGVVGLRLELLVLGWGWQLLAGWWMRIIVGATYASN